MTIEIHKANERGESNLGWLHSRFSFSFADYYNPDRMGFGKLRVLNDDIVAPGKGFGSHPHNNMEIISIPTEGTLAHKDSTGTEEVVKPGDVQVMSAGSGIIHSEYNHSNTEHVKFFQIWIETKEQNIEPRHEKRSFTLKEKELQLVVSGNKDDNTLYIHQDAKIFLGKCEKDEEIKQTADKDKGQFVFVIEGSMVIDGNELHKRDAAAITDSPEITGKATSDAYFMIIEVPL